MPHICIQRDCDSPCLESGDGKPRGHASRRIYIAALFCGASARCSGSKHSDMHASAFAAMVGNTCALGLIFKHQETIISAIAALRNNAETLAKLTYRCKFLLPEYHSLTHGPGKRF